MPSLKVTILFKNGPRITTGMLRRVSLWQCHNWEDTLGAIAPPSSKNLPFLNEHKNRVILFVLPHFNSDLTIEKI